MQGYRNAPIDRSLREKRVQLAPGISPTGPISMVKPNGTPCATGTQTCIRL